ncbi:MAG: hypothetical protein PEPC_00704 [Peptostreptococcus russellii]|uniref:ABC transporter substrate-binding (seleno)protein SaoB n=1 Tax=Peptostreptococcus russellii TaxID=215200 RepID=UPI0030572448
MQWALSSENIDIAIICKEAADKFMNEENKNFVNLGPLVENSDVILLKNKEVKSLGVIQNRDYQKDIAEKYFHGKEIHPFIGTGIAYALEANKVDAIVVDAFKAFKLEGEKIPTADKGSYETYVLIANKDFIKTDTYSDFVKLYNRSVEEISKDIGYRKALNSFFNKKISDDEWKEVKSWKIKFLKIKNKE